MCRLSRPILLRMTTTMRGTDPTGPPECCSVAWSTNWGCSLETNMLRVVTTSGWIASRDLFECCLAGWSTIESNVAKRAHLEWLRSQGKVHPAGLLQSMIYLGEVQLYMRLFSSLFFKKSKSECCMWTDDDAQLVEKPLCSDTRCWGRVMKNVCKSGIKIHTHTHTHTHRHKVVMFIKDYQQQLQQTIATTLTKGYEVTLYSDWLRATALYIIYRSRLNLSYPKGQCEYGHYTLVFDRHVVLIHFPFVCIKELCNVPSIKLTLDLNDAVDNLLHARIIVSRSHHLFDDCHHPFKLSRLIAWGCHLQVSVDPWLDPSYRLFHVGFTT